MNKAISDLISMLQIHPILFDIGASGGPPNICKLIAPYSIYVGFDPNFPETDKEQLSGFWQKWAIEEAVVDDSTIRQVPFYLTKRRACSSTLEPDLESLSNYIYSDGFTVEAETQVKVTTLNSVLERLSLPRIDYLKLDAQGTDLRIFNSLKKDIRSRVLALDIELPLMTSYAGEDVFVDAHRTLTENGFWPSNFVVGKIARMRRSTYEKLSAFDKDFGYGLLTSTLKKSPKWCGAIYLRTLSWMAQNNYSQKEYAVLWIFAFLEDQIGFALDIANEYEQLFGRDDIYQIMWNEPILQLKEQIKKQRNRRVLLYPLNVAYRFKTRLIG